MTRTASAAARRDNDSKARLRLWVRLLRATRMVEAQTRERFKLADDVPVVVAEIACGLPWCPPLETVVAFWTAGDRRHQFKLFKPVEEVTRDDLPFAWLLDSLMASELSDCC